MDTESCSELFHEIYVAETIARARPAWEYILTEIDDFVHHREISVQEFLAMPVSKQRGVVKGVNRIITRWVNATDGDGFTHAEWFALERIMEDLDATEDSLSGECSARDQTALTDRRVIPFRLRVARK